MDLALNNLQRLICHKTQTNKWTNFSQQSQEDVISLYWNSPCIIDFGNYYWNDSDRFSLHLHIYIYIVSVCISLSRHSPTGSWVRNWVTIYHWFCVYVIWTSTYTCSINDIELSLFINISSYKQYTHMLRDLLSLVKSGTNGVNKNVWYQSHSSEGFACFENLHLKFCLFHQRSNFTHLHW